MRHLLTAEQSRAAERLFTEAGGEVARLMEAAGEALACEARQASHGRVAVFAGKGNNGGDGWVAARCLHERGRDVEVFSFADCAESPEPAASAATAAIAAGVRWPRPDEFFDLSAALSGYEVAVDALLGLGLRGEVGAPYAAAIAALNDADCVVVSADVPSGIDADTGRVHGIAVDADVTVTFSASKPGLVTYPGTEHAGAVVVAEIGVPRSMLEAVSTVSMPDPEDYADMVPRWREDTHKGARGRVLIVGGSPGMTGAVALAAKGALRSGAGYAVMAVPEALAPTVAPCVLPALSQALPSTDSLLGAASVDAVLEQLSKAGCLVIGPGLGHAEHTLDAVRAIVEAATCPVLVDADALRAFVGSLGLLRDRGAHTVITPHPGEAGRLLGRSSADVQADRLAAASELSGSGLVCVLKGTRSVISDGTRCVLNPTGNPGMATAGTGDVLSGVIGTFLAQGSETLEAAALGAYVHGLAGDLAAEALTVPAMTSEDVVEALPDAFGLTLSPLDMM